jgi:ketosteroid isomerase-like protein
MFHPEIEWVEPPGWERIGGTRVGHLQTLVEVLTRVPESAREFQPEPEEFLDAGENIVVLGHHRGVTASTGVSFEIPFAHIWTMRDGLAVKFRSYVDTALMGASLPSEP